MKIIRFVDEKGAIHLGTDWDGNRAAVVLQTPSGGYEATGYEKTGYQKAGYQKTGETCAVKKFLPPVNPAAIFCIGLNYKAHAAETGAAFPQYPVVFMKNPAAAAAHKGSIVLPESCREKPQVDYEAELAVVIGRPVKNVTAENALDYVKGYTVGNDISARFWQKHGGGGQWVRGKSFDSFCPLGPELVTCEDIRDPGSLGISLTVNGRVMQKSNTADMIFSVSRLIAFLSEDTTLLADTVILTGTPEGVGFVRNPPVFLKPGDVVKASIEKIGTLENTVI